jgi:hypothetical protein
MRLLVVGPKGADDDLLRHDDHLDPLFRSEELCTLLTRRKAEKRAKCWQESMNPPDAASGR